MAQPSGNRFIDALRPEDRALLQDHLSRVRLSRREILHQPGENIRWVHFPCDRAMVALLVVMPDGRVVQVGLTGCEGVVGGVVTQEPRPAFTRAAVQIPGEAWRIDAAALGVARARSVTLAEAFARHADCLLAQLLQTMACSALHSLEQRMAGRLIEIQDRLDDAELPLTQEELGEMLGVGRTYVSKTAGSFQARGLIGYSRGRIRVQDRAALRALSCACHDSIRDHFERLLPGVHPAARD
ncbi:Crp/Fnr family transcriptional regulator [Rubellimicrobium rubrum]|uniref:Crp/Fnr family transcriptional regulator n=1 Tax=Rubellimicrobium rubrum TaxID=2585369 RepID=A0A5C4N3I9_9RHOB|nr:Crp/Fnr family transcriptional regulator [Rubellimicrobium rubrum]TNC52508.1 Crp/Fnr family transcriptional regulator [Rubellimicrobium rubrum]